MSTPVFSPIEVPEDMSAVISNSEVSTYLSCEMKHYFAFGLDIEPKKLSTSLTRGSIGHEALAAYYKAIMEGAAFNEASSAGINLVAALMLQATDEWERDMLMELTVLLNAYFDYYRGDRIKPILVEEELVWEYMPGVGYGMRLDLYGQYTNGAKAGRYVLMDHKFVYDFKSLDALRMNPQLPKYKAVLEQKGYRVDDMVMNQIRHRTRKIKPMTDDERFNRQTLIFTDTEIRNIMREQIIAADQIMERRSWNSLEDWKAQSLRSMNEMNCENCMFLNPCKADLGGQPIDIMLATEYRSNGYRYQEGN